MKYIIYFFSTSDINAVIIENGNSCPTEIQSKDSNIETFDVPIHNSEYSKYIFPCFLYIRLH